MVYTRLQLEEGWINYYRPKPAPSSPFFGLMLDEHHRPNGTRIAFRADSRVEVDRLASVALAAGAQAFEAPEQYASTPVYYAAFFEDVDGNRLEISYTED